MARPRRKEKLLLASQAPRPQAERLFKAGAYGRLSAADSRRPGSDTMEVQMELLKSYIEAQPDMKLCGLYWDNGRTGTNFERPGFRRLMEAVGAGEIDCIVVKDLSRFGRSYREAGGYLERLFPLWGVRFVAVNDHYDTAVFREGDGCAVPLKNIINEFYSRDISRKSGASLAWKQQKGDFIGNWAPYGYRKCAENPSRLEPEEETASVVRRMFQWRSAGGSCGQIARRLNELEIPSPARRRFLKGEAAWKGYKEGQWSRQTVRRILSNQVYLGHMVQGRKRGSFCRGKKQEPVPKEQWTVVKHTHRPLIDEETFWKAQAPEGTLKKQQGGGKAWGS